MNTKQWSNENRESTVLVVLSKLSVVAFFVASSSLLTASAPANSFSSISAHWKIHQTSTLSDSCLYSSVPAEEVTTAILINYASFHSLCCLMNRKVERFKQCFYRNNAHKLLIKHYTLYWTAEPIFVFFMCLILFFFNTACLCLCFYAFVFYFVLYW